MSVSESELYEAGCPCLLTCASTWLLCLLESVDPDEAFDMASESWLRTEAAAAYDALKAEPSRAIPAEDVRARFKAKWARPFMTGRINARQRFAQVSSTMPTMTDNGR